MLLSQTVSYSKKPKIKKKQLAKAKQVLDYLQ